MNTPSEHAARDAERRGNWQAAYQHYSAAAALVPDDPHGCRPAERVRLERRAHVAKSMHDRLRYFDFEQTIVKPTTATTS